MVLCKYKGLLYFDFFLFEYNCCIEYDGEQHFISNYWFGGDEAFESNKIRDNIKTTFCEKNDIFLLRISYKENIEKNCNG